jgi:hypothetical protein
MPQCFAIGEGRCRTWMWMSSPATAVKALLQAHELPAAARGALRSLNLRGLTATVAQMIEALRRTAGASAAGSGGQHLPLLSVGGDD